MQTTPVIVQGPVRPSRERALLDRQDHRAIVRNRKGNVLNRGLIIKTDHFAGNRPAHLSIRLQGAPNFRKASLELGVYGVAQPSVTGIKTILASLKKQPKSPSPVGSPRQSLSNAVRPSPPLARASLRPIDVNAPDFVVRDRCVWVCTREEPVVYIGGRPYVLRDEDSPTRTLEMSDRAANIEAVETRLKDDILQEAARNGDLFLVHEEDPEGRLLPTWINVDHDSVSTVRELFEKIKAADWQVDYHRVPIGANQAIENNYLDAYAQIFKTVDPRSTTLVANCGAGVNRTTFAMVAALLIRRKQSLLLGHPDPFAETASNSENRRPASSALPASPVPSAALAKSVEARSLQQAQSRATLKLVKTIGDAFPQQTSQFLTELLLTEPLLVENLRSALAGDFGIVRQLAGLLDEGLENKAVVDAAIDACSHVTNLREAVMVDRVQYAARSTRDGEADHAHLGKALRSLERYFFLVAFASYVNASRTAVFEHRFADWLKGRAEIWNCILRMRAKSMPLYLFDPIADLSVLSMALTGQVAKVGRVDHTSTLDEIGDEFAAHIIRNRGGIVLRSSTLLKSDIWRRFMESSVGLAVRGTVSFRRVPHTSIYATGQPTVEGVQNSISTILREQPNAQKIVWINLREEPLVYISGKPYCLRPSGMSLRNLKAYSGISWRRLQQLEDRLKGDVLSEIKNGDGRLLLHTENEEGAVVPVWEEAASEDVDTVADVMHAAAEGLASQGVVLDFRRIPITAEKVPDPRDVEELLHLIMESRIADAPLVVNDQLGRGRATLTLIIVLLVTEWMESKGPQSPTKSASPRPALQYHLINSLIRVLPRGLEVKRRVDDAIERCSQVTNIIQAIDEARLAAEDADDKEQRAAKIAAGVQSLRRYFQLLVFTAYLLSTTPSLPITPTFSEFVDSQPVLETLMKETDEPSIETITALPSGAKEGVASESEEQDVISNRNGAILSPFTMLKSDFFPGILKGNLPIHVDGMPNMRGAPMQIVQRTSMTASTALEPLSGREIWGQGMPSVTGLRAGLTLMGAAPGGRIRIVWTCLREEPVLYVKGLPHVLRLSDQPLTNVEATGIATDVVERMETALKADVLGEAEARDGFVLLHDEVAVDGGKFEVVPVWEKVSVADVLTPREVYEMVAAEKYQVDYARIAITDEQAPQADVFSLLEDRIKWAMQQEASMAFNCQAGKGRTTTAMVIATLVSSISQGADELVQSTDELLLDDEDDRSSIFAATEQENEADSLLRGEWRQVLSMIPLLKHGQLAKRLTDLAIDQHGLVLNLRTSILDVHLRLAAAAPGSSKWKQINTVKQQYLERYGFLIAFTDYLLGSYVHAAREGFGLALGTQPMRSVSSFPAWLSSRPEVVRAISRTSSD